jgi:hypothetical protein
MYGFIDFSESSLANKIPEFIIELYILYYIPDEEILFDSEIIFVKILQNIRGEIEYFWQADALIGSNP